MRSFYLLVCFLACVSCAYAQKTDSTAKELLAEDSIQVRPGTKVVKTPPAPVDTSGLQSPREALIHSAIIPGWGQIRNHKWWKVPLVYGGFVSLGLVYNFNQRYYKEFLAESQYRKEHNSTGNGDVYKYPKYADISDQQIFDAKDFYRRNRDLSLYATIAFYGIQMIDAYIDARLATFDVSDDLSIRLRPSVGMPVYASYARPVPMLKLTIKL